MKHAIIGVKHIFTCDYCNYTTISDSAEQPSPCPNCLEYDFDFDNTEMYEGYDEKDEEDAA